MKESAKKEKTKKEKVKDDKAKRRHREVALHCKTRFRCILLMDIVTMALLQPFMSRKVSLT